mmetsp:Transcript_20090/g.37746  ORF Transcript_20090/g.37746 Transcript_20090/m.37746 type:complete len:104 (-) Transcript_20090:2274-2585(-)
MSRRRKKTQEIQIHNPTYVHCAPSLFTPLKRDEQNGQWRTPPHVLTTRPVSDKDYDFQKKQTNKRGEIFPDLKPLRTHPILSDMADVSPSSLSRPPSLEPKAP